MTDLRQEICASARHFYQQGWMMGTAGNLSAQLPDGSFWITASGKQKGQLTEQDFVRLSLDGELLETPSPANRPSAETSIHQAVYQLFSEAKACYHVHSVEANLVSKFCESETLELPPLEMIKGFGIWEENPQVVMPVFENYLEVPLIAKEMRDRFSQSPPQVPALLIRHHGVTVWGKSTAEAHNRLEIAEYIFRYIVALG